MRVAALLLTLSLLSASVAACAGSDATLAGTLTLFSPGLDVECQATGEFSSVAASSAVVVKDSSGATVATSRLGVGRYWVTGGQYSVEGCDFLFTVEGIPPSGFYTVAVADTEPMAYARPDLDEYGWEIAIIVSPEGPITGYPRSPNPGVPIPAAP